MWGGQGFRPNSAPCAPTQEGPQWLHMRDFDRLLRESQREVLRLQRQIALRNQQESSLPLRPPGRTVRVRARAPTSRAPGEVSAGTRAGVWVCVEGAVAPGSPPETRALSSENPVLACALQGLGSFPDPP